MESKLEYCTKYLQKNGDIEIDIETDSDDCVYHFSYRNQIITLASKNFFKELDGLSPLLHLLYKHITH